jgi:hypothetical protein
MILLPQPPKCWDTSVPHHSWLTLDFEHILESKENIGE